MDLVHLDNVVLNDCSKEANTLMYYLNISSIVTDCYMFVRSLALEKANDPTYHRQHGKWTEKQLNS